MTSSRTWVRRWVLGLGTVLVSVLLTAADAGATPFHFKEFAQGAIVSWTSCPESEPPPTPTVCHDYTVWFVRVDVAAGDRALGPVNRAKQPFEVQYEHLEYVVFPDGEGEDLAFTHGRTTDVIGHYDKTHL